MPTHLVDTISFRHPRPRDAAKIWRLAEEAPRGSVDPHDHAFTYLRLCSDFADTGAVAVSDERIVGFALGMRPSSQPETFFLQRFGVADSQPGFGLRLALLDWIVDNTRDRGVRFVEATLPTHEDASWGVFTTFAQVAGVAIDEAPRGDTRCTEILDAPRAESIPIRIGPLDASS